MNFLLFFSPVLMNCIEYKITYDNYDSIKKLIPNSNVIGLYKEIIMNRKFSCRFEIYRENEYDNTIGILDLNNIDPKTGNNIFPEIFCEINNIKCLLLNNLTLSGLPDKFVRLKELEELYLGYNRFKEFPQILFSLSNLKILYLNDNEFNIIPFGIIHMNNLEILNIGFCSRLISINSNLFRLTKLKELNLSNNPLLFRNDDFISCLVYSEYKTSGENEDNDDTNFVSYNSLKKLFICGNGLSTFPRIFSNSINLEQLDISNNSFEEIPYEIHSFINLEILNISNNCIKKMIIVDGMFKNLIELYLRCNKIPELSISDIVLQSLETLDLSFNRLSKIDRNILKSVKRFKKCIFSGNIFK
ncbi:Leucine rich repeat protein [Spraguea lophii 42_110]|uniref:Leucine rich repeat protein n=1 Tax=Spraguea lophii (strain 42_110) TaxID=1358809 RepID=S7XJN8_SPRLO|nr:Leucine rich repeat protein [Spraguea lophii 42_110]